MPRWRARRGCDDFSDHPTLKVSASNPRRSCGVLLESPAVRDKPPTLLVLAAVAGELDQLGRGEEEVAGDDVGDVRLHAFYLGPLCPHTTHHRLIDAAQRERPQM